MTSTTGSSTLEHAIGSHGRFTLRLPGGEVALQGVDGDTVRVSDRNQRSLEERFQIERTEGALSLAIRDGSLLSSVFGMRERASANLLVEVPRGASVTIETVSADVQVVDVHGAATYRTTSGEIALERVSGSIEITSVSGDVDLDASNAVDLRAQTVSGDVELRSPSFGRLELATTSGDMRVDARFAGAGPFSIQTVSGDAEVVGRSGLAIEAKTITGDLSSDLPHRSDSRPGRKSLIVGDGEVRIAFQSVSGDLEVTEPRDVLSAATGPVETVAPPAQAPSPATPPAPPVPPAPVAPAPTAASDTSAADPAEEGRLAILRALERGEISIDDAARQLGALEEG